MKFYLGTHKTGWLDREEFRDVPLFVSHRQLRVRSRMPRAVTGWALDSGGFTELSMHGAWETTPEDYAAWVRRYADDIGRLEFASPQDHMCEPWILERTGLSVAEHQKRTVENLLELRALAPDLPFIPVLQGWELSDYSRCMDLYADAGVDLTTEPLVGLGSVCRRQATSEIAAAVAGISHHGINLHGFGVKTQGLARYAPMLASADSMAWSRAARWETVDNECRHGKDGRGGCQNCPRFALTWRETIVRGLP